MLVAMAHRKPCDDCVMAHVAMAYRLGVQARDLENLWADRRPQVDHLLTARSAGW